jgi:hypothetical protein
MASAATMTIPTLEEQRAAQIKFWQLPPDASWDDILERSRDERFAPLFYHPDDLEETLVRLYGPIFTKS